ncbi:MAG: M56 family metallopeptidase, partial [Planctomycetota bacterium]
LKGQRRPLTAGMQKEIDELLGRFGVGARLRIWLLDDIGQPFVWGLFRGSIFLPAKFGQIGSREHRRGILMHEIAHVLRLDAAVNFLQAIAQAVFWFHPLVWLANRNIRAEREKCCDEMAIAKLSAAPKVYSSAIVDTLIAEYQSTQPVPSLAIAGPIRNIEDRIKTIMKPGKKFYNRPTIIAIVTILLLAIAAVPTTIALTHKQGEKRMDLERVVVEGIRANRDKFECGILAWSRKIVNALYEDPRGNQSGQHELWWDGKKMATKYLKDELYNFPPGGYRVRKKQGGDSYDGGILSRKPDFREDNWLGPDITRWRGLGSQDWLIQQNSKREGISKDWSAVDVNGVKLIRFKVRSTNETARDYRGYSIRDYDPSKGYGLVNEEWYNPDGSRRRKHTVKLLEVIPGGWFPVEVDSKSFAITDGRIIIHHHYALDIERCNFNDKSALPKGIFKLGIEKQLKYQEKLQKYLAMELEGLSDVKEIDKTDKVKLGARVAVEEFVAAALAGDLEKAAEYAHPDSLPANHIAWIAEIAKGQNLWIMAVVADDLSARAVSSVIRGDRDRTGPLVFSLDRVSQDGRDNWWVHDIDMETPDGAEGELKRFLEKHPEAEKILSDKADVQVEDEPVPQTRKEPSNRRTTTALPEFIKTLPNGVKVELVGVCEYPSAGKQWWRPDGSRLDMEIITED